MIRASLRLLLGMSAILWVLTTTRFCNADDGSLSLEFTADCRPIIVPVRFKDRLYTFLLDTGSPFTTLDRNTFREAIRPYPHTLPTDTPRKRFPEEIYNPGGLQLNDSHPLHMQPLYVTRLNDLSAAIGRPLHGILGCDFLRNYELTLDSDNKRVALRQSTDSKRGTEFKLVQSAYHCFSVLLDVPDTNRKSQPIPFLIDTGFTSPSSVAVCPNLFDPLVEEGVLTVHSTKFLATASGIHNMRVGIAQNLTLISDHQRISISEQPVPNGQHLLGMGYLTHFNVTLDFPNMRMYVAPRKTPGLPLDLQDCSGFGFIREHDEVIIKRIEPASPTFKADLRLEDIIVSANGVPGKSLDLDEFRIDLCQPGKQVDLKIRRNRREHSVTLHLEDSNKPVTAEDFE